MDAQRISKNTRTVAIVMADGSDLSGEVFLNPYALPGRAQRVGELLSDGERFLPVRTDSGMRLLNKRYLLQVRIPVAEETDDLMFLGHKSRVRLHLFGAPSLEADLYLNLPSASARVKDYLNQSQGFLTLISGDAVIYVNDKLVLAVDDLG